MAYFNRVRFTTVTTGTGPVTVGAASAGYSTPAARGMVNGQDATYAIEDGAAWETGTTVASSSATVLSRTLEDSSTGALLNLSGTAIMFLTPTAAQITNASRDVAFLLML